MNTWHLLSRVHNSSKSFFKLRKSFILQTFFLTHTGINSEYNFSYNACQILPIVPFFLKVKKWRNLEIQTKKEFCLNNKLLNRQWPIEENRDTENIIGLINSEIKQINRVSKSDVIRLHNNIKEKGIFSSDESLMLLKCCGKLLPDVPPEERTSLALSAWETLRHIKSPLTLQHYNALLSSLADNKHAISVKDILSEIQKYGLKIDAECFHSLLRCVSEVGDVKQAEEIKALMIEFGMKIDQEALDCLMLAYGRKGDMKTVKRLSNHLEKSSTVTVLLKVLAEAGEKDWFSTYLDRLQILSEDQKLDVSVSLAIGNLIQIIPLVLEAKTWTKKGVIEAKNVSIQLAHLSYPEAGMIILTTLKKHTSYDEAMFADFFIEELLKSNTEVSLVIKICNELSKYNQRSLIKATECALILGKQDDCVLLIKEMKEQGHPIRPHYFWPLIIHASNTQGETGILNTLYKMQEMEVKPDFETLRYYILPRWKFSNIVDIVKDLRSCGLTLTGIMTPALRYLLSNRRIQDAVELCSTFKTKLDWNLLLRDLAYSFIATGNVTHTVALLSFADNSAPNILMQLIMAQKKKPVQPQHLELLLKALSDKGYELSTPVSKQLNTANPITLGNGSKGDEYKKIQNHKIMNLEELECHLLELKAKRLNTRGVLRKLFQMHCGLGNIERATEIKKELFEAGFVFSSGMMASLFQLYVSAQQIQEAESCLKELQENHPHFKIDSYKVIDFATILVNNNQFSKAVKILEDHQGGEKGQMMKNCWRLLNAVAKVQGITETKQILTLLLTNKYSEVTGEILSPLINAHLERNDMAGAVEEFENCFKSYKKTSMLYDLLCQLSKHREDALLQKVLEIGKKLHGAINVNTMLVTALAEENLSSDLLNVIRSPRFVLDYDKLLVNSSYFVDKDNAQALENIINCLKEIPSVNVEPYCHLILKICSKSKNKDAASKLWMSMQESNIIPSEKFTNDLNALMAYDNKTVLSGT